MKYSMIALVALFMFLPAQGQDSSGKEFNLLIGTYTEPGKGEGIYVPIDSTVKRGNSAIGRQRRDRCLQTEQGHGIADAQWKNDKGWRTGMPEICADKMKGVVYKPFIAVITMT